MEILETIGLVFAAVVGCAFFGGVGFFVISTVIKSFAAKKKVDAISEKMIALSNNPCEELALAALQECNTVKPAHRKILSTADANSIYPIHNIWRDAFNTRVVPATGICMETKVMLRQALVALYATGLKEVVPVQSAE